MLRRELIQAAEARGTAVQLVSEDCLLPFDGGSMTVFAPVLDGGKTLGIALGIDNYLLFMLNVFSKRNRRRLAHSGWTGWLCIGLAAFGTLTLAALIVYVGYSLILDAKAIIDLIQLLT